MRERLEALLSVCRAYDADSRDRKYELPIASDIRAQVPTARKIVEAIDPDLIGEHFGFDEMYGGFHETRSTLEMAPGLLADKDELAAMLAPDAPSIVADQLHSIIWQSAAPLWDTGEYKTAVQQSAVNLSAHIKARVGSHLNERELVPPPVGLATSRSVGTEGVTLSLTWWPPGGGLVLSGPARRQRDRASGPIDASPLAPTVGVR
jgi:hypothetical protein